MIHLDLETGHFEISGFKFSQNLTIPEILALNPKIELIDRTVNFPDYPIYALLNLENGEYSLTLSFKKDRLLQIELSLDVKYSPIPFTITKNEVRLLKVKLEELGGEQTYSWGNVRLIEDNYGGNLYIRIDYGW